MAHVADSSAGHETRLVVEPFDPRVPMVGGVDTCIRGLLKFHPENIDLSIVGLDVTGDLPLGEWVDVDLDGRPVKFMAVYRGNNSVIRPKVPHSVSLALGTLRYRRRMGRFDTLQSHRVSIGFVIRRIFPRKPHVQFVHNDGNDSLKVGTESYFQKAVWAFRFLEQRAVKASRDVVVFNREATERLLETGPNVRFSPTWFDDEQFFPATDRAKTSDTVSVVWLGRFEPPKDPLLAIEAMKLVPDNFVLTMVGGGSLVDAAKQRARELGLGEKVKFFGIMAKDQVGEALRGFDALLMTSHHEGFPRAVVETLASGVPVITTQGGEPNGLVVEGVNGTRALTREPADIAAAIERITTVDVEACRVSVTDLSASRLVPIVLGADL